MKVFSKRIVFIFSALLILLGICLRQSNTTSFLGLTCWALAAVMICYFTLIHYASWRLSRLVTAILTVIICIGAMCAVVTGFLIGMATSGDPNAECCYVVVLGAKVNGTEPSRTLSERIDAAADYLFENPQTVAVVSGGQGSDEGISEAQCMYHGLTKRGIAPERLILEANATSTWENINYSLDMIEEKTGVRPNEIGLITSEFHLYRAILFAKECGVSASGIPAKTGDPVYFLNYFLREIAGIWHYLILGN